MLVFASAAARFYGGNFCRHAGARHSNSGVPGFNSDRRQRRPPLALVAALQDPQTNVPLEWLAHEVAGAGGEALTVGMPPRLHARLIGPREPVVLIHPDVWVVRHVVRPGFEALGRLAIEIQRRKVHPR